MAYDLNEINFKTVSDPAGFAAECEENYNAQVRKTAEMIMENMHRSPIVLLSGPSGSGKTTTAMKISQQLNEMGVGTHYISMDEYFNTVTPENTPKTPDGEYDLESPLCLDMELLNEHFTKLSRGERIYVPKYEFASKMRSVNPSKSIKLEEGEVCVVEGIHALNDMITERHSEAFKLHISANSDVEFNGQVVFKKTWFRLVRRMVRDYNFRGSSPEETMSMWANVRRGENLYISPYKSKADYQFDTSFACEMAVMNATATKLFSTVPEGIERYDELREVFPAIQLFGEIEERNVPEDSLLREFIGGGIYN